MSISSRMHCALVLHSNDVSLRGCRVVLLYVVILYIFVQVSFSTVRGQTVMSIGKLSASSRRSDRSPGSGKKKQVASYVARQLVRNSFMQGTWLGIFDFRKKRNGQKVFYIPMT